jgi:4-hydroxybenzoate polyprenyltransferase
MGWHLAWQLRAFDPDDGPGLLRIFRSNRDAGLILTLFFAVAAAL